MANPNLVTVAQLKLQLANALAKLDGMDNAKPINLEVGEEDLENTIGFIAEFCIEVFPSMDEEQSDVNVNIKWLVP